MTSHIWLVYLEIHKFPEGLILLTKKVGKYYFVSVQMEFFKIFFELMGQVYT